MKKTILASLAAAAVLGACGGGDDHQPLPPTSQVPPGASQSVAGFISYLKMLVATAPAGESLTLFSSSWKDRLAADAVPGTQIVDSRVPGRVLHLLWHRAEWPPVASS